MKKFILSIALLAATVSASAQLPLRIEALGNFSSYTFSGSLSSETSEPKFAFGLRALFNVMKDSDNSNLEVGIGYQMNKTYMASTKGEMTIHNLMIPFGYSYGFELGSVSIIPKLGFYMGFGLSGKTVLPFATNDPFSGEGALKQFDLGSDDQIAIMFCDHYCIGFGWQFSFFNLCTDDNVRVKNDNLYISLGYQF